MKSPEPGVRVPIKDTLTSQSQARTPHVLALKKQPYQASQEAPYQARDGLIARTLSTVLVPLLQASPIGG